jgi:hypothetical protein
MQTATTGQLLLPIDPGTAAVISRTTRALLLSRVQATAAELHAPALAADEQQDRLSGAGTAGAEFYGLSVR